MRRALLTILGIFLLSCLIVGQPLAADVNTGKKIRVTKYPGMKLGYLSAIFLTAGMGPTLENELALIDLASEQGFAWMEIRDPNAALTVAECRAINAYGILKHIELSYAINKGPLDSDYPQVIEKALKNAAEFTKGPRTIRVPESNMEFMNDPKKMAWTEEEFKKALQIQYDVAKKAKTVGLQFVNENANLPVSGPYGFEAYMDAADKIIGWQLDTANMFCISKMHTDPKESDRVIRKFASRIFYTHLKSSVNGVCQPVLGDNELDNAIILSILAQNKKNYVAIEVAQVKSVDEQKANLIKSLEYLKSKGIITIK